MQRILAGSNRQTSSGAHGGAATLARDAVGSMMHRIDAWGVALVVCALALVTHDAVTGTTLILMFTVGLAYWLGYTVNDFFDAPFDAKDRKGAIRFARRRDLRCLCGGHVGLFRPAGPTKIAAGARSSHTRLICADLSVCALCDPHRRHVDNAGLCPHLHQRLCIVVWAACTTGQRLRC